jgi:hypothetical protein
MKAYKITITINKFNNSKWLDIKQCLQDKYSFSTKDIYYYKSENKILIDADHLTNTLHKTFYSDILPSDVEKWSNKFYEDLVEINGSKEMSMVSVFSGLDDGMEFIVPGHELSYQYGGGQGPIAAMTAINDHTCPTCKNDRCSRNERTCWRCGNKL